MCVGGYDDSLMGKAEVGGSECMLMQQQCDCLYYRVDKDMLGGKGGR